MFSLTQGHHSVSGHYSERNERQQWNVCGVQAATCLHSSPVLAQGAAQAIQVAVLKTKVWNAMTNLCQYIDHAYVELNASDHLGPRTTHLEVREGHCGSLPQLHLARGHADA